MSKTAVTVLAVGGAAVVAVLAIRAWSRHQERTVTPLGATSLGLSALGFGLAGEAAAKADYLANRAKKIGSVAAWAGGL